MRLFQNNPGVEDWIRTYSGQYLLGNPFCGSSQNSSAVYGANQIFYYPLFLPKNLRIDRLALGTGASAAGALFKFGLYTDIDYFPGTKLAEGIIDLSSGTNPKTITVDLTLKGGRYWTAHIFNGTGAPTIISANNTQGFAGIMGSHTGVSASASGTGYKQTVGTSYETGLPTTATQESPVNWNNTTFPLIWYRIA